MRTVPHPVMVVTAEERNGKSKGLLVSSFNTVTLSPEPIVSFNIKLPSSTYDGILRSRRFSISAVWCPDTAHAFATGNSKGLPNDLHERRAFALRCEWLEHKSVEIHDHVIMLGRVLEYIPPLPTREATTPLIYSQGDYRKASPPLKELHKHQNTLSNRQKQLKWSMIDAKIDWPSDPQ